MNTEHSKTCKMAFGRKDPNCPRCIELLNGAKPIAWNPSRRAAIEAQQIKMIKSHKCTPACGPVCTAFQW